MRKTLIPTLLVFFCLFTQPIQADNEYMVEKGDSLSKIASLFGVSYTDIMKLNNMTDTTIFPDQIIRIPIGGRTSKMDHVVTSQVSPSNVAPSTEKDLSSKSFHISMDDSSHLNTAYIPPVQGASKARPADFRELETYTVQHGDTIWSISRRFGVASLDLSRVNHLKSSSIQVGQILKLPEKAANVAIASN
jgi:peptidoglycan DL-endopeptidase LytF